AQRLVRVSSRARRLDRVWLAFARTWCGVGHARRSRSFRRFADFPYHRPLRLCPLPDRHTFPLACPQCRRTLYGAARRNRGTPTSAKKGTKMNNKKLSVAVVGAGMGGLAIAAMLQRNTMIGIEVAMRDSISSNVDRGLNSS